MEHQVMAVSDGDGSTKHGPFGNTGSLTCLCVSHVRFTTIPEPSTPLFILSALFTPICGQPNKSQGCNKVRKMVANNIHLLGQTDRRKDLHHSCMQRVHTKVPIEIPLTFQH